MTKASKKSNIQSRELRIHGIKRAEVKSKDIDNLVNKIIGKNFPNLEKEIGI